MSSVRYGYCPDCGRHVDGGALCYARRPRGGPDEGALVSLEPTQAVYALARTQLDWLPSTTRPVNGPRGFAHGRDVEGRQLRWLSCPDCLANGFVSTGCETCHGAGEVPDDERDPYEVKAAGGMAFFGESRQVQLDRQRWVDAELATIGRHARIRAGLDDPEDWLSRALRVRDELWGRGDYRLLHEAQQLLGLKFPLRHLGWVTFVVEQHPLSPASAVQARLDETAGWLADRVLAWIVAAVVRERSDQETLGIPAQRIRTRPERIVVPVELERELADAQQGRGRWANGHAQGQRNALIYALAGEGQTAGQISRRVGVTKRRVQQILEEQAGVASGPAA